LPDPPQSSAPAWDLRVITARWQEWAGAQASELASKLGSMSPVSLEAPGILVIEPAPGYNWAVDFLEKADVRLRLEASLSQWLARRVTHRFRKLEEPSNGSASRNASHSSRDDRLLDDPLHKLIVERFEARAVRVEAEDESDPGEV
jgi:hypothetical protein